MDRAPNKSLFATKYTSRIASHSSRTPSPKSSAAPKSISSIDSTEVTATTAAASTACIRTLRWWDLGVVLWAEVRVILDDAFVRMAVV